MRPAGLANVCTDCGDLMPFDPQALNQLCNSCNRVRAFGGLPRIVPDATSSSNHDFRLRNTFSAPSQPTVDSSAYQSTMYRDRPQPTMTPLTYELDYSVSPLPVKGTASLKRKYSSTEEEMQYPNKRPVGNAYAPQTPSSLRQSVWPPTFDAREDFAVANETDDEAGDDFVDAHEDQAWNSGGPGAISHEEGDGAAYAESEVAETQYEAPAKHESAVPEAIADGSEADAEGEIYESEHQAPAKHEDAAPEIADDDEVQEIPADHDDLFAQTFGNNSNNSNNATDNESDKEGNPNIPTTANGEDEDFNRSAFIHTLQTNNHSTTNARPKRKPFQRIRPLPLGPLPVEIPKHLGHNLKKQHSFHHIALNFLPRLPLAEHRYWIGVLKIGVPPRGTQQERNFTWMKGNRLTTIETVWRAYCTGAAEDADAIVLLLGYERPGLRVRCEELDYFADRRIILRAVRAEHRDAVGRGLAEELVKVQEVVSIEVDAEEEGGKGSVEGKGKEKEKGEEEKKPVFIEVD